MLTILLPPPSENGLYGYKAPSHPELAVPNFSISCIANDYKQQKEQMFKVDATYICSQILPDAKVTLITHIEWASKMLPNQL